VVAEDGTCVGILRLQDILFRWAADPLLLTWSPMIVTLRRSAEDGRNPGAGLDEAGPYLDVTLRRGGIWSLRIVEGTRIFQPAPRD
jgi:hypothetical protein